ncbi:DUF881 domain-containing protein [Desulfoscipio gibsoniae]
MTLTSKPNLRRFMVLIPIFLLMITFGVIMGCTDTETPSEQNSESIQILSGAIDVEGKGISITFTDNESNKNDMRYIVHDEDIIAVVNQLNAAGAEVISINDERLISTSKIKANGMSIKVNNNDYNSPFIIKAIGDPDALSDALKADKSYVGLLRNDVGVKIEKEDKLLIPKYKENIYFRFAKPVKN